MEGQTALVALTCNAATVAAHRTAEFATLAA